MESAASPVLVKLVPVTEAKASANRPSADEAVTPHWRARTACSSTPSAPSPSSSPITAWMLSVAGPFEIALARLPPWSALGTATYTLTYIPIPYSATTSTRTARLPRRTRARPAVAAVRAGRAVDLASMLISLLAALLVVGDVGPVRPGGSASPVVRPGQGSVRPPPVVGGGQQLAGENVCQPLLVPLGRPASVTDEQPVDLGGHERVDDVGGVALAQARP